MIDFSPVCVYARIILEIIFWETCQLFSQKRRKDCVSVVTSSSNNIAYRRIFYIQTDAYYNSNFKNVCVDERACVCYANILKISDCCFTHLFSQACQLCGLGASIELCLHEYTLSHRNKVNAFIESYNSLDLKSINGKLNH